MSNESDLDSELDGLVFTDDAPVEKAEIPHSFQLIVCDPTLRPNSFLVFATLYNALFGVEHPELPEYSNGLRQETIEILSALGAVDSKGARRVDSSRFREAWLKNDLDWFHREFMKIRGYYETIVAVKQGDTDALHGKGGFLNLARVLGQVARLEHTMKLFVGTETPRSSDLKILLDKVLPEFGDHISLYQLSLLAAVNLGATPYKLEKALTALRKSDYGSFPFEPTLSGAREPGYDETVVRLKPDGFEFETISSARFKLGEITLYRELVRVL